MASVGEILKKERDKKGLTLRQIEKEIKIREKTLRAVEENNWNFFSSKIYITGVIRSYSQYLGLDTQKILAFFRRDFESTDNVHIHNHVAPGYLTPQSKKLMTLSLFLIIVLFLSYFGYQLKQFLSPPKIVILSPQGDKVRSDDLIKIVGKTEKEATVTIYGEKVYPNKEGTFEYSFPVRDGKNELVIEVVGANGKKTVLKKNYFKE